MLKPLAMETDVTSASCTAADAARGRGRVDVDTFEDWPDDLRGFSAADPDTLARAVRAHKAGDAFAQAALTLALMLAIGAVAVVLSTGRAAAADFLATGTADHAAALGAVAVVGAALMLTVRMKLRQARVRIDRRRH